MFAVFVFVVIYPLYGLTVNPALNHIVFLRATLPTHNTSDSVHVFCCCYCPAPSIAGNSFNCCISQNTFFPGCSFVPRNMNPGCLRWFDEFLVERFCGCCFVWVPLFFSFFFLSASIDGFWSCSFCFCGFRRLSDLSASWRSSRGLAELHNIGSRPVFLLFLSTRRFQHWSFHARIR